MKNFFVGLAVYFAVGFVLYTTDVKYNDWQFWAVFVLMVIDKANLRDYLTGNAFPRY
jgi:hypothetical protein